MLLLRVSYKTQVVYYFIIAMIQSSSLTNGNCVFRCWKGLGVVWIGISFSNFAVELQMTLGGKINSLSVLIRVRRMAQFWVETILVGCVFNSSNLVAWVNVWESSTNSSLAITNLWVCTWKSLDLKQPNHLRRFWNNYGLYALDIFRLHKRIDKALVDKLSMWSRPKCATHQRMRR